MLIQFFLVRLVGGCSGGGGVEICKIFDMLGIF